MSWICWHSMLLDQKPHHRHHLGTKTRLLLSRSTHSSFDIASNLLPPFDFLRVFWFLCSISLHHLFPAHFGSFFAVINSVLCLPSTHQPPQPFSPVTKSCCHFFIWRSPFLSVFIKCYPFNSWEDCQICIKLKEDETQKVWKGTFQATLQI